MKLIVRKEFMLLLVKGLEKFPGLCMLDIPPSLCIALIPPKLDWPNGG